MTDDRAGRRASIVAVALQFFLNGAVYSSIIPRLPDVRSRLDIGIDLLGVLLTLGAAAGFVGSLAVGPLIDRFGSRRVMVGSAATVGVAVALLGSASSVPLFLAALAAWQAFDVGTDAGMNLQASRISESRAVPIMNRMHGMWSLGTVAGGLVAAALTSIGVSLEVHLAAVGLVVVAAQLYTYQRLLKSDEHDVSDGSRRPALRAGLLTVFVFGAAAVIVEVVPAEWAAFRLTDDLGTPEGFAALGFVAIMTGMVVGRLAGDWVQVRTSRLKFDVGAVVASAAGVVGVAFASQPWMVLLSLFVAGLGVSVIIPALYDSAAQAQRPGHALGSLSAGIRLGTIVAPVLVGLLAVRLDVGLAIAIVALPSAGLLLIRALKSA